MVLSCGMCSFRCLLRLQLIQHSFQTHSAEPTFHLVCGIKGCLHGFTFGSTYSSFKSHASRKHCNWQEYIEEVVDSSTHVTAEDTLLSTVTETVGGLGSCDAAQLQDAETNFDCPSDDDDDVSVEISLDQRLPTITNEEEREQETSTDYSSRAQRTAGLFLLTFKEKYCLTQAAIDFAVGSIQQIVHNSCASAIESAKIDPSSVGTIGDPFSFLQTNYQQTKFYREEFGLVEPVTIELGKKYKYAFNGVKRRLVEKSETFQYIPLLKNLQWLLRNKDICDQVFRNRPVSDGDCFVDYCDGQIYKQHPLFGNNNHAVQLIAYFDEVEVANPLGSYKGHHKLGVFYYVIGNVEPKLRSSLRNIQLIACVTTPLLQKYGFEKVLRPFIDDANKLSNGVMMTVNGEEKLVMGGVLFVLADTLAAHQLGGFKVGVGFSLRKCRMCLATKEQISTRFKSSEFTPRTPESYNYHCLLLEGPLAEEDSVTYGVLYSSPLNKISNFHVVEQLPQDIMHVLLEGVIPYELTLMLDNFICEKGYLTLVQLNDRIACFAYSLHEVKDKPSPITYTSHGIKLSQTAAQMWNLAINFPLMIGDVIPQGDEKWECFLLLLDILQLCTTRTATTAHLGILEALICNHHHAFISCYADASVIPKFHYMVHFPQQIKQAGPLICACCMRMEAKNSYFKKIARSSNFKNVPYTVSRRHQRLLCSYLQSGNFFNLVIECGPVKEGKHLSMECSEIVTKVRESTEDHVSLAAEFVQRPKWVSQYLIVGWQDDDLPIFGKIKSIVVVTGKVLFCVHNYNTAGIDRHYHSFILRSSDTGTVLYWFSELSVDQPFTAHCLKNGCTYITFRSHFENLS